MSSYRQTLFILIILIVIILFVNEGQGAPHHDKRHTACVLKIFKALNVMCNHEGDADVLRRTASDCCRESCSLTEMLASCTLTSSEESTRDI
ncbi:B-chain-like peptide [Caenorhabditis elegans]|uniref:Probable insulin-like peptide gamma-type 1 n=1 Tax=Caenorhabditis elegans TaxID=6239 RepID=ILG1_CAEEL|nr:B-chain-like peptide [Caenorhabditis elegans]Q18060.1 RecName: Full=Probable insulin-like peptide gamma-type 1; AltName: Full=Ceinsulin-3; Contains: RecName: Full=B-chain-like peptide; Contains: RecName: Full=A-chain-like peptide; Flags: Precursor [Caenorhabditis elegans]BAA84470.1 ceinsulin-3 [Caenorhabditis elegans]CCD64836.1 B-chain-like peptide [Caenorhabditis elegans]|eukprot:NP_495071.1 B-chain-like peptide [Caenorhabditis elegans]